MDEPRPHRLWHYACRHSADAILNDRGTLRPNRYKGDDVLVLPVVWLTDLDVRSVDDADLLGLASNTIITCDRTEFRFRVPRSVSIHWWPTWADAHLAPEHATFREDLERYGAPDHWWVSLAALSGARLDERYVSPRERTDA